jgi:branched-chain amino acid transport system ATP-binding protein
MSAVQSTETPRAGGATAPLLRVEALRSGYGQQTVLDGVSLDVLPGEIVAVVGANGAGKTTLLLTISGHLRAFSGRVSFAGADITTMPAHAAARARMKETLEEVMGLFPILAERRTQLAGRLSGGERQMCAMARAMMSLPRLLMLDEPSLGLAPIMVDRLFDKVHALVQSKGLSVLLVEQNVGNALRLAQRGCILEHGRLIKVAPAAELLRDPDVQRSYMGL